MVAEPRRIILASPVEPSGASWLINCLLELDVRVDHKPVVDKVWRNAQPPHPASHMWQPTAGQGYVLHPQAAELRKWLPALSRPAPFCFGNDLRVHYVQDPATAQDDGTDAVFFVRDPRDALYSMYKRRPREQSLEEFLDFPNPSTLLDRIDQWTLQVSSWIRHPRVHVYRFEDYKRDADALFARILDDLEIALPPERQARAVAASTYERAREAEARYRAEHPGDFELANRAGRVGEHWHTPDKQALVARVNAQAQAMLDALGYGAALAPPEPQPTLAPVSGFTGASPLARLEALRGICVAPALQAIDGDEAHALSRRKLVCFAESLDRDTLQRSGLATGEIRQLLDSLRAYFQGDHPTLGQHAQALREAFSDGADYHWQRVRELLAHRRRAKSRPSSSAGVAQVLAGSREDGVPALYNPDRLLERAEEQTGHGDATLSSDERIHLERLCTSLHDSALSLTFFGRARAEHAIVNAIAKRLRLQAYTHRYPEINAQRLHQPLVIVSPFRTGTTFAHRLLAQDPGIRWTRSWEVFLPPPAEPERRADPNYLTEDPRIDATRRYNTGLARRHPHLAALHATDPAIAEECFGLLETSLLSHSFMLLGASESYSGYIDEQGQAAWDGAYARYVQQLQLLQWWWPGDRWLLKSPFHLWQLQALARALPEARFVQLHREPTQVALSFCELLRASFGAIAKPVDPKWIGVLARASLRNALRAATAARRHLPGERFLHLDYGQLIRNPLGHAARMREFAAWQDDAVADQAMERWVNSGSSKASPAKRPSLDWYGLDATTIDRDFADYQSFAPSVTS